MGCIIALVKLERLCIVKYLPPRELIEVRNSCESYLRIHFLPHRKHSMRITKTSALMMRKKTVVTYLS
jgi:hypothetical protein